MKPKATMSPATMKPTVSPIAAQPTTFASYTSSVNSTINPALSVAVGVVNNILNEIPLPRWAVYTLSAAAVVLVLVVCICICCKCCCKSKKKKQQKNSKVNLKGLNANTTTALVQPNVTDVNRSAAQKPRGKLLYSLEYSAPRSELIVGVKQADNLLAMDMGGSSDPYVKVYILPDKSKTYESKVLRNTLKPVFNEKFNFLLPKSSLGMSSVVMQVFDFNRFSKHEMIGEIRLPLAEKDMNHVSEEWRDLSEPAVFEEENLGEICFSLRYVPVNSKLTVVILEAKNLKSMDIGGTSDPYVKVQLALDKRKWKKRKTSVKKKTLNPYYNESFTFNVSFDLIKRVNLILSVWDHDKMSRNDTMGKIFLGGDASGNQLRHWADMLSNPRRPVAQWHSLLTSEQVNSTITLKSKVPGKIRH